MAQSDIDKILEDIKRRKEQAQKETAPVAEKIETPASPKEEKIEYKENSISDEGKKTLDNFLKNDKPETIETDDKLDAEFEPPYVSKKSEDYIDENFMNFFTQSVIVTKTPEQTREMQIKRKKNGLFKKKYVTDSLSLNLEALEEKEKEAVKKQKEKTKIADAHIVKTAGDVYVESFNKEPEQEATKEIEIKPEKTVEKEVVVEKPSEKPVVKKREKSLNDILGDDKDAESLARRILRRRRKSEPAKKVETAKTAVAVAEKEPEEQNPIVNSIYTSVIEAQAKEAVATDEMTGYIPEFPDEEEEKTTEVKTPENNFVKIEEEPEEEEVFEEYVSTGEFFTKIDDESTDIRDELMMFRQTLSIRIILGLVCGGILALFNVAANNNWNLPAFISPSAQPMMFTIACFIVYALAFVGFFPTVISGFKSTPDTPAPDSLICLGAVMSLIQIVVMIIFSSKIDFSDVTIFAPYMCLAFSFNAIGKKIATNTIIKNLTLAKMPEGINAGYIINDTDAVKRLARSLDEKVPKILVSRKTGSINNFVKAGFSIHNSDYTARKLALATWVVTILCFILGWVNTKDFIKALSFAAGAAAMQCPLSQTLVNSVPSAFMQKSLEKVGALVNGWQGIDQLSKTTHVNIDAKHLFPKGTVILHGIKAFEKERIDLAIIYAASVLIEKCSVLKPVFMDVIEGKTSILYPVDSCEYIECQGYVSWINNNRVIIGNRSLMEKYDIPMPPISLETRFTNQGRKPIYLSVGGKLFGMFVLSYHPDRTVKENLDKLCEKGVSIILSSSDFNIDADLIENVYNIPSDYVSVMNQKETALLSNFTSYAKETEACMAHLDSLPSLVSGFCSAESARSAEKLCSTMQIASVVITAVLSIMFTWSQTLYHIPLLSIFLINFGFMGLTMMAAVAKKY